VTLLAWVTIVPAAFGVLVGLVQNLLFAVFMSPDQLEQLFSMLPPGMEALPRVSYGTLRVVLLAFLAVSVLFLATGVGLLKRRNWARVMFIAAVALGTLYSVVAYFFIDTAADLSMLVPPGGLNGSPVDVAPLMAMMRAATTVLTLVFTALNLWLIWWLLSPALRREFSPSRASS
jgi:cbb3-type cytochrome oxidase subunit 3